MPGVAEGLPRGRRARVRAARAPRTRAPEPRRAPARRGGRARCSATSRTSTPCSPTPPTGSHDPWSGEVHDGALWGRGAIDMKSQTAAEAVAAAHLARKGWRPPRGELKVISVVDEEAGGRLGAQWLTEQRPDAVARRLAAQRGRRRRDARTASAASTASAAPRRARSASACARAAAPATPRSRRSPTTRCSSSLPALERLGDAAAPSYDVVDEPRAFLEAIGEDPAIPAGAVERMRAIEPRLAALLEPTLGATFAPTLISAGEKINVIPARAEFTVDCRLPPGHGRRRRRAPRARADRRRRRARARVHRGGRRQPLADRVAADGRDRATGSARPTRRRGGAGRAAGVHRLALVPRRVPRLRRLRLLPPAPPGPVRVLAADALRRRAHRRARHRLRRASSSPTCPGGCS